jgi:hypothetical protein
MNQSERHLEKLAFDRDFQRGFRDMRRDPVINALLIRSLSPLPQ